MSLNTQFQKVKILLSALTGILYKWSIDMGIMTIPPLRSDNSLIVSLTSYGRRVESCVYYTLVSLLRQSEQPSRIVLWLSEHEWNDSILPKKILTLRDKNVEIRYCKDLRSYKKLIPTLALYPESTVITVDDDVMYSPDTIASLLKAHILYPYDIICLNAAYPIINKQGFPQRYHLWKKCDVSCSGRILFPIGSDSILYPAHSLHPDVTKEELFMKLCPHADDIWFWFCGLRKNTNKQFINKRGKDLLFDSLYQYLHNGSALSQSNRSEHQNDRQFHALFNYYRKALDNNGNLYDVGSSIMDEKK